MAKTSELGTSGLAITGGTVLEEWNNGLKRTPANNLYREMRDNDPIIGAVFFVIEYLLTSQEWRVEPGKGKGAKDIAKFVEDCIYDMDHPWSDFIHESLSMLQFGWAFHEVVYKLRPDGRLGLGSLPLRGQNSLLYWGTDSKNRVTGMYQNDMYSPSSRNVFIPVEKAIHFTTTPFKRNPEGRSILRSAVRPYNFLKRLQEIEAIGIERELAGLPVLQVPPEYLDTNASASLKEQVTRFRTQLAQIRRDEREGVVFPAEEYSRGGTVTKTGFKFSLLSGGGKRAVDTNTIITRYENRIATTMLAQFILLGSSGTGSYALADKQAGVFTIALQAALARIADGINHQLVPKLLALNGLNPAAAPTLRPEKMQDVSLATLATFVNQLVSTNVLQPDDALEDYLRKVADLPEKGEPRDVPGVTDALAGNEDPNALDSGKTGKDKVNVRTEPAPGKRKVPR